MRETLALCDNLVKIYQVADLEVVALQGLDLTVAAGEMLAIVGASGSGKSTLLNILGGLDTPSAGTCQVGSYDLLRMNEGTRARYRRSMIGHIWQQSGRNLLPTLSIAENVEMPQLLAGVGARRRARRARELLDLVGLGAMTSKRPSELSGGEQQRAALAVAIANAPVLLLADEPTGELDSETAKQVMSLLRRFNSEFGMTTILVTHDVAIAAASDRTIAIRDGRTSTETVRRDANASVGAQSNMASAVIGLSSETHQESILIDRVGRLQLPHEAITRIPFNGRAIARIEADHVEIWPLEQAQERTTPADGTSGVSDMGAAAPTTSATRA